MLLNQGDGTFAAAVAYDAGRRPAPVAIGDLDGVNGPDLAVASATHSLSSNTGVSQSWHSLFLLHRSMNSSWQSSQLQGSSRQSAPGKN